MNRIVAKMDELPELPFEKVLSYLSLQDVIRSRAVSRAWKMKTDNYRVKTLCYSGGPREFIWEKSRWVSGAFAQNFISSTRCISFFNTFSRSILSRLKHLRFYDLDLYKEDGKAFAEAFNSFGQLEVLDIICASNTSYRYTEYELNLPMLKSLRLERLRDNQKFTLDAPRLQKIDLVSYRGLNLVHCESVERVTIDLFGQMKQLKNLKNLKQLYVETSNYSRIIDPTLLSNLEQLKEIHLNHRDHAIEIFEQKRRYGRTDLKVYLFRLLLNGPDDPEMNAGFKNYNDERMFVHWAENPSRLADEILFYNDLHYSTIERVAPESAINIVKRFTNLCLVIVDSPVQDVPRFLNFLKNLPNIVDLYFWGDQPQDLFDRLPDHCAVQWLIIPNAFSDFQFLFRMKNLVDLDVNCSIDGESIRKLFEELQILSSFKAEFAKKNLQIEVKHSKRFEVQLDHRHHTVVSDINSAIEFISRKPRKRRRTELELLK